MLSIGDYISKKTLSTKIAAYHTMLPRGLKASKRVSINVKYDTYIKLLDNELILSGTIKNIELRDK